MCDILLLIDVKEWNSEIYQYFSPVGCKISVTTTADCSPWGTFPGISSCIATCVSAVRLLSSIKQIENREFYQNKLKHIQSEVTWLGY